MAGIMLAVWALMLLLFIVIEKLIVPIPPPMKPGGALLAGLLKAVAAFTLAGLWLYAWHGLVKAYRRRALRRSLKTSP